MTSDLADPDSADASASEDTTVRTGGRPLAHQGATRPTRCSPASCSPTRSRASNSGPQDATGVTLTDTLPAGVTFESATPTQGTCSEASGTVTCALGTIANSAAARASRSRSAAQSAGTITNEAERHIRSHDPDSANNSASADDDGRPGRRPVPHEDRLPRPGAGRRAGHLHAHRAQRRARRTRPRRPSPTRCRAGSRSTPPHRRRAAARSLRAPSPARSARSPTKGPPRSRSCVRPSAPGTITNQASVSSSVRRPEHREQLRHGADDASPRQPSATRGPRARPRCGPRWCRPTTSARAPNRLHGPPLGSASCNPPVQRSSFLTIGSPDANAQALEHGRLPAPGGDHRRSRWTPTRPT